MRITTKGQVTIPVEIRERFNLLPDTEVEWAVVGSTVQLRRAKNQSSRGAALVAHMAGRGNVKMSTDEILALTRDARRYRTYFPKLPVIAPP
jgi:AbrB family looped-hinge helix DNA binding protein